jgi:pyridoxamine-phosphate oxidase
MADRPPTDRVRTDPELSEHAIDADPFVQFDRWFADAVAAGLPQPEAVALATAGRDLTPSVRMVLLKGIDAQGFVFYTNLQSAKARDLEWNPRAGIAIHWQPLHRQVRAAGPVARVSRDEAAAYFATRPRGAQLAALASAQSRVLDDRETLLREYERLSAEHEGREITLPEHWGGYRLAPDWVEFWQGREHRLHDRLRYVRLQEGWRIERLSP